MVALHRASVGTTPLSRLRQRAGVDGRPVEAVSGQRFPAVDPAQGKGLATVPRMAAAKTRAAIEAAQRVLAAWSGRTAVERAGIPKRRAELMLARPTVPRAADTPMVMSNEETFGPVTGVMRFSTEGAPSGGMKESGIGREGPKQGLEQLHATKCRSTGRIRNPWPDRREDHRP